MPFLFFLDLNRQSGASDDSFRITPNPSEMFSDDEECDLQSTARQFDHNQHCGADSTSVLIPPSHKSTRIVHTSGLSFMSAEPLSRVHSRTRHIPVPSRRTRSGTVNPLSRCNYLDQTLDKFDEEASTSPPPIPPHRTQIDSQHQMASDDIPPPIPPHRNTKSHLKPSTTYRTQLHAEPVRPKHLSLTSVHTPKSVDSCKTQLDYKAMVAVLDRLKESSA